MSLYAKRLERGRFIWPSAADGAMVITSAQLVLMAIVAGSLIFRPNRCVRWIGTGKTVFVLISFGGATNSPQRSFPGVGYLVQHVLHARGHRKPRSGQEESSFPTAIEGSVVSLRLDDVARK